jgi:hypothetical protein
MPQGMIYTAILTQKVYGRSPDCMGKWFISCVEKSSSLSDSTIEQFFPDLAGPHNSPYQSYQLIWLWQLE